ncbi:hypothetical protein ATHL_01611 [Anaerolinea thermolimosa]|uniref:hypothetical protein n=1 Tax=Anaerolinea thermolimosa TaxID=229919 RepID=UPI000785ECD9|nr:hypothetical protein [Anaerolinea thermolimosa]GAP06751.1 hypothetical protein ATHL_01611 [Anaerolinea thermolimosa]
MNIEQPIMLQSDRLTVEISQPGVAYHGTRFDWSGFITQVTLDGQHTFCVPEDYTPGKGTGGIGICNEFGIDQPIGYDEAKPGECFPKLGIGLLTRLDSPTYSFWNPHQISQPFPIEITASKQQVIFTVHPIECRGYAARLTKQISVENNRMMIQYELENTGEKSILTNEYVHNFIGINQRPIGPDYTLRFPQKIAFEDITPMVRNQLPQWIRRFLPFFADTAARKYIQKQVSILNVNDRELSWHRTPATPFYCRLTNLQQLREPSEGEFCTMWELHHSDDGLFMSEKVNFPPERIALWGTTHVVSVEVFKKIELLPGDKDTWARQYEFGICTG